MENTFNQPRPIESIDWKYTVWYNGLRAVSSGLVWSIVFLIFPQPDIPPFSSIITAPLGYFVVLFPIGLIISRLDPNKERGIIANILLMISFVLGLYIAIGDPIVYFLSKIIPKAVPVEKPAFFSPRLILFVNK